MRMEKRNIEQKLGCSIPEELYQKAVKTAKRKLQLLIQRFGDNNGVRRSPEYLSELVIEAIKSELLTEYAMSVSQAMQVIQAH